METAHGPGQTGQWEPQDYSARCPRCRGRIGPVRQAPGIPYAVDHRCLSCGWAVGVWVGLKRERLRCLDCGGALAQDSEERYACAACQRQFRYGFNHLWRMPAEVPEGLHLP